jgi:hypothetical protein
MFIIVKLYIGIIEVNLAHLFERDTNVQEKNKTLRSQLL